MGCSISNFFKKHLLLAHDTGDKYYPFPKLLALFLRFFAQSTVICFNFG